MTANTVWRDYITDGVPGSGANKPVKADIRAWGTALEVDIAALQAPESPQVGIRVSSMMLIDQMIAARLAGRPPYLASTSALVEDIVASYTAVASIAFVAVGPFVRISTNGYWVNITGGSLTAYVKTDLSGVSSTDSYEIVNTMVNSENNNFATIDRLGGLTPGTSYTARLLVKQSGASAGFDARGEIFVESF